MLYEQMFSGQANFSFLFVRTPRSVVVELKRALFTPLAALDCTRANGFNCAP